MKYFDIYDNKSVRIKEMIPLDVYTSTQTTAVYDILPYRGNFSVFFATDVTNAGTLTVKLQHSVDGSTSFNDVTANNGDTAFTAATTSVKGLYALNFNADACRRYIRVVGTMAGGCNSVAFAVYFMGKQPRTIGA